ncbi:MAG: TIGR00153 family protein [Legionella sp.]|nr:TIGR00153 family protein [Legionella sp.]
MSNLFNVFGPSPIRPLEQHMRTVDECARQLHPFFEAVLDQNWPLVEQLNKKISSLEREADRIKRDLRLHLPTGLFLPVSRIDLLELLNAQDRIANKAQDIAGLIVNRRMLLPDIVIPLFLPFLECCLDASKQARKAINELDELLETSFRGNEVKIVERMIMKLDTLEHESDSQLAAIRQAIFQLESELPPIDVIFLYKLVQWVGDLADYAQIVGGRLQILIAR